MRIASVLEMREMDRAAIEDYGIPEPVLMEQAALAAARVIDGNGGTAGRNILVLCGSGNNGGDGFALARILYSRGGAPVVFFAGREESLGGGALLNRRILANLPIEFETDHARLEPLLTEADLVVDALFGTGLNRDVDGAWRRIIERLNTSDCPVLSLDIPSGIQGDTGRELGVSVRADDTVTFGAPKRGNLLYPGFARQGRLHLTRISFPPDLYGDDAIGVLVNRPAPPPDRNGVNRRNNCRNG